MDGGATQGQKARLLCTHTHKLGAGERRGPARTNPESSRVTQRQQKGDDCDRRPSKHDISGDCNVEVGGISVQLSDRVQVN